MSKDHLIMSNRKATENWGFNNLGLEFNEYGEINMICCRTCCEYYSSNNEVAQSSNLKVQSCKLYNNKYMNTSTQITNTEIFAFIAVLVFNLLSYKVLFISRKDNRNF